ncbi:hypothetical protein [Chryseobacterium polytrichastri]|uniref:Uncharacterized protein n=1 Tax=Chryseobacterium polytrichastri TaxID=1302687 RepID=A0A1M6ZAZ7_9FLAO|nr:hypothetical protein [Chryseobacterium polytrichastri]SHL27535.1 hypothetical protein SAMN05444267_101527 [Chryseobacterium polytrichastri]
MSKKKLLIHEVFRKAEEETGKKTKNGLAAYLWSYFDERFPNYITDKTLSRYYDTFIRDNEDRNIDSDILDKFSQYVGYMDFADFSSTFIKKDDEANKTTVKISVDEDEESLTEKLSKIIINITNEQHFKMPDLMKKNGLGIMEIGLLLCLVTGNVVFSNNKKMTPMGFMSSGNPAIEKKYMYWDGERYMATDSSYINPGIDIVAMNAHKFLHFKKIMRKDTLTEMNALGKTWYSKYNSGVEFFTDDGVDPETGRELRRATPLIIFKYAGKPQDSIEVQE